MFHFSYRKTLSHTLTFALFIGLLQATFSQPVLATDCSWSSRPGFNNTQLHDKTTVTVQQIAFDLCYVAGQLYPAKRHESGWASQAKKKQIMQQMEEIVTEANFLSICPTQGTDHGDQNDPDHALPDHTYQNVHHTTTFTVKGYGCGPYPAYHEVQNPKPMFFQRALCPSTRPLPYRAYDKAMPDTNHPPTRPETAAFDLCRASTKIANTRMSNSQINSYIINLMADVHLALTCANGRSPDADGTFSIPFPTSINYIATRGLGCPPVKD